MSEVKSAAHDTISVVDERALIQQARHDKVALAELYQRHAKQVLNYVQRRVGDTADAEDIVAVVFLAMVKNIGRFTRHDKPLIAWLYRVATNEINRRLRRCRVMCFIGFATEPAIPDDVDIHNADHVRLLLLRLPLKYQTVLSMHYLEQLPIEEIAEILSLAEGTIKSRLARGRGLLRTELESAERRSERRPNPL